MFLCHTLSLSLSFLFRSSLYIAMSLPYSVFLSACRVLGWRLACVCIRGRLCQLGAFGGLYD